MKIHKWASNAPELMASEDRDQEYYEFKEQDPERDTSQALGLLWHLKTDMLTFKERNFRARELDS